MKKLLCKAILIITLVLSIIPVNAVTLSDISGHWAKSYIETLVSNHTVSGYPEGTFKPDNTITVAEFIKIFLISQGTNPDNSQTGYWADNYIKSAAEKGYIEAGEFEDVTRNITRGEIARMIVRALPDAYPDNLDSFAKQITDYSTTPDHFKDSVLKAYVAGIITGRADGGFYYKESATRAEAAAMIVRLIDYSKRVLPVLKAEKADNTDSVQVIEQTPTVTPAPVAAPSTKQETDFSMEVYSNAQAKALVELKGIWDARYDKKTGIFTVQYTETNPHNDNREDCAMYVNYSSDSDSKGKSGIHILVIRNSKENLDRLQKALDILVPDMSKELYEIVSTRMAWNGEDFISPFHKDYNLIVRHIDSSVFPREEQGVSMDLVFN